MNTYAAQVTQSQSLAAAVLKLVRYYCYWYAYALEDVRSGTNRKITQLAEAKLLGVCDMFVTFYPIGTPAKPQIDIQDWVRDHPRPVFVATSKSSSQSVITWEYEATHHLIKLWGLS